jgi:uncharacterized protein (TIGR01370 family)
LLTTLVAGGAWLLYATSDPGNAFASDPDGAERRLLLANVTSWSYEAKNADPLVDRDKLGDLVIVDSSAMPQTKPSAERKALNALQQKPDGSKRLVIGYLSIAEAEQRRTYWRSEWIGTGRSERPTWLREEHPNRRGNWKVNIADPGWHSALYGAEDSLVDRMIVAGFDGIYLDASTALDEATGDRSETEWAIAELISRMAAYARQLHPRFVVMLDDAELLAEGAVGGELGEPPRVRGRTPVRAEDCGLRAPPHQRTRLSADSHRGSQGWRQGRRSTLKRNPLGSGI